ncbi:MAG TPA: NAD(P)-dependent oxidoreductase [Bryobacteraceae bacterium]|nr:NAD(P)-dependent oxidoreductase [Bryobacteraceae bacterium]
MAKRILITGHLGYIGSVMTPHFLRAGYEVHGADTGFFEPCRLVSNSAFIEGHCVDLRDELTARDLEGFDAVIHLAALSNDPIGNLNERWTREINGDATLRLATLAREAGVSRFLFSSSCIMYGASSDGSVLVDETSPLDPRTQYARSKVDAEQALRPLATSAFSPIFMRNGTIYGLSPRMRFDTVLNSFAGSAVTGGSVRVFSDGKPWRPVVHIEDVCAAFQAALEAPRESIHNEAFNVGAEFVNVQIGALAQSVAAASGARLELLAHADADQRTYRTSFAKIARHLPGFQAKWTPQAGATRLIEEFRALGLTRGQFEDERFTRLRWLRLLLNDGSLGEDLRWAVKPFVPQPENNEVPA